MGSQEATGSQFINELPWDTWIEAPIKIIQSFGMTKIRGLGAASQIPLVADVKFVLQDQFQKLGMAELVGRGFLQAGRETLA